jgi:hypothetical protein
MAEDPVMVAPDFAEVRARRASLRRSTLRLEAILIEITERPLPEWPDDLHPTVSELLDAWRTHSAATESPGGILRQVEEDAPRLANMVQRMEADHRRVEALLAGAVETMRRTAKGPEVAFSVPSDLRTAAELINRHRRLGSELLYRAYQVDLGGGE